MSATPEFTLSGTARPEHAAGMLDQICEHFADHAEVSRKDDRVYLRSAIGEVHIRVEGDRLQIDLACPSRETLQMARTMLAEHLFYFAGEAPLELSWTDPPPPAVPANLHEITVIGTEEITPRMLRVKFAAPDVTPFIGGNMHVRLLVPPRGRAPVWPVIGDDGRVVWPKGDDTLLVRVYTIRAVDADRGELWIDFLQHPAPGIDTPGADFARDARPGDTVAIMGPGGGGLPEAETIFLAGDETALPAIARIAAEVPAGTRMQAIIEVEDATEEQPMPSAGALDLRWLHRADYREKAASMLADEAIKAIAALREDAFIWAACERREVAQIRQFVKSRSFDRKKTYIAWYWEREPAESTDTRS